MCGFIDLIKVHSDTSYIPEVTIQIAWESHVSLLNNKNIVLIRCEVFKVHLSKTVKSED